MRGQQRTLIAVAGRTFKKTFSRLRAGSDVIRTWHRDYDISDIAFRHSASYFSLLAQRKRNQKKCTLASACFLRCSSTWASNETRPDKPHTPWLVAELEQPLADNSHADCATRRVR
jgi:hypothetical protein